MKVYTLERRQDIGLPLERVFDFFSRPENLPRITPPAMGMRILTPGPVPMHAGSVIDYVVQVHGIPMRWTSIIAEYDAPHQFADVQLRGPYAFWHHTHVFQPASTGTLVIDRVRYALPFGPFGRLAHGLFVRRDLENIFNHRGRAIETTFRGVASNSVMPAQAGI